MSESDSHTASVFCHIVKPFKKTVTHFLRVQEKVLSFSNFLAVIEVSDSYETRRCLLIVFRQETVKGS